MKPTALLLQGDARSLPLCDQSVHCVVTSPPYWGLRDYGLPSLVWDEPGGCEHEWGEPECEHHPGQVEQTKWKDAEAAGHGQTAKSGQFCLGCSAWRGSLGLEPTVEMYVAHLVLIFKEVHRVLRDNGVCWLNLGDSYAGSWGNYAPGGIKGVQRPQTEEGRRMERPAYADTTFLPPNARVPGLKPKDLIGVPWRVAFALQADGWWLRSDIIWSKPNPMPESVTDRPTRSHEYIFLLSKAARYYYDAEAIKEPLTESSAKRLAQPTFERQTGGPKDYAITGQNPNRSARRSLEAMHERVVKQTAWDGRHDGYDELMATGRNRRTVWEIATAPFPDAHFATFPPALVTPCILAGTSERGACPACGAPWERAIERTKKPREDFKGSRFDQGKTGQRDGGERTQPGERYEQQITGWRPTCACGHEETVQCRVLDPFAGSGTVPLVAQNLGRVGIGVELKAEYLAMAQKRTAQAVLL